MSNQNFWKKTVEEGAVLNPVDRISEVLFGLIMVLTFTGAISVATDGREEIRELLWAALGCNVAWGFVDAIMYLMNVAVERGHGIVIFKRIVNADTETARSIVRNEIQPTVSALMTDSELDELSKRIRKLPEPTRSVILTGHDIWSGVQIFLLVFLCTFPVALPFMFFTEIELAMRVSNGMALLMLFIGGYWLAGYAGFRKFLTGFVYALIGVSLVALTMALGG
jgi:hypothetical protein